MSAHYKEPVVLKAPVSRMQTRAYPWLGLLLGAGAGVLVGHPTAMMVYNFHEFIYYHKPLDIFGSLFHSFHLHMWPMITLYALLGGAFGIILGLVFQRLRENRLRLDTLHQEFELQVATLRHHYKNLALGIHGFSNRIKRKLADLDETMRRYLSEKICPSYEEFEPEIRSLGNNFAIIEDAAQRLTHTLGQELLFLKALSSDTLASEPRDFYPLLIHCIQDLKGLRFRDKDIRVEINGCPCEEWQGSLVFSFEPYTMEIILQNIISNAMNYGDRIHISVTEEKDLIKVAVKDNGPGLEMGKIKERLLTPTDRRGASTHLGLRVTLHLLEKCGGRLLVWSEPGAGAEFTLEVPKH